jgi:DNA polymerase III epsilon subunit family exonuclease
MSALVIDCETTGLTMPGLADLSKQPRIIEFAAARIEKGKIKKKATWLIYPGEQITDEITRITGITNAMLKGKPRFPEVLPDIVKAFKGVELLIAHNAPFDCACLKYELQRAGIMKTASDYPAWWPEEVMCTVQEYKHEFGHRPKLTDLYMKKIGKPLDQKHRAIEDVLALVEILIKDGVV